MSAVTENFIVLLQRLCEMLTVQDMLDMPNSELVNCLHMCGASADDSDRLTKALQKLKQWRGELLPFRMDVGEVSAFELKEWTGMIMLRLNR